MVMKNRPQDTKFLELRARTDRELLSLIERRLDLGLKLEGPAAEKIYLEVAPLLMVANPEFPARARLQAKLARLEEVFDACAVA